MMTKETKNRTLSETEKQTQPMPGEVDPKNVKIEVFLAMQKAKIKSKARK